MNQPPVTMTAEDAHFLAVRLVHVLPDAPGMDSPDGAKR
jgi:hypothetical protein